MKIRELLKIFLTIDFVSSIVAILFFDLTILLNIQIAFFSSFLIVIGSYVGFRNNIVKQSETFINTNDRDTIDEIDDKFDLYGEINESELSDDEIRQIIKDEKDKIKIKDSITNTMKSFKATTSVYRIAGYLVLVGGFFYLNNNHLLNPIAYLCGFLIVPIMALTVNLKYIKS